MKNLSLISSSIILLFTLFYSTHILAQNCPENFEGIIKYVTPPYEGSPTSDTLIVYFGKDKIRFERLGSLRGENYASVTDEYIDFTGKENVGYYFSTRLGLQTTEFKGDWIETSESFPDSIQNIIDHNCFKVNQSCKEVYYYESTTKIDKTIWVSEKLCYNIPENWDALESPFYANGTGKIALKIEQRTELNSEFLELHNKTSSYSIAIEIIPQKLPDSVFKMP